ncbi:MAG: 30S ribosomal protein S1 [Clostridia bacterium]|nr:30S ribosomal protein S1 [Clostridia bacterium]
MNKSYYPEGVLYNTAENREFISTLAGLERAMTIEKTLEAPAVMCDGDMNLYIDLGEVRGIIPREEVALCRVGEELKSIAIITRVGKPICFKVISIEKEDGKAVAYLSRRAAQADCKRNFLDDLIEGDIIDAKVTHMENFGAFVDIGCGIVSLLTIDCISVSRISHPKDRFSNGDHIPVIVKSIDRENDRIFVTHRELLGTWEENADAFSAGETVFGIVRSIEDYGIFIELAPNLAGLAECKSGVNVGDVASVYIKSILPDRMKVKLVLIDSAPGTFTPKHKYFIDTDRVQHIDVWRYSPASSERIIESKF